jgi:hypothetical protein
MRRQDDIVYARHMCPAGTEFTFLGWPLASFCGGEQIS